MAWILLGLALLVLGAAGAMTGISLGRQGADTIYRPAHARSVQPSDPAPAADPGPGRPGRLAAHNLQAAPLWTAPLATHLELGYNGPETTLTKAPAADWDEPPGPDTRNQQLFMTTLEEASAVADTVRSAAEQDAARIKQQASDRARAIQTAAEREAAELRAVTAALHKELNAVTAYLNKNVTSTTTLGFEADAVTTAQATAPPLARPATEPAARPATKPPAGPAAKPAARPAAPPASEPGARPAARPGGTKTARTRQSAAARLIVGIMATLLLFVVVVTSTELGLHGYAFFVFRSSGTGATNNNGLQENQGPGQPDAPGAHHH